MTQKCNHGGDWRRCIETIQKAIAAQAEAEACLANILSAADYCFRAWGADPHQAEDLKQELAAKFESICRNYDPTLSGTGQAYIRRIVRRIFVDDEKKKAQRASVEDEARERQRRDQRQGATGPEDIAARNEAKVAVRECIDRLPLDERLAIILVDIMRLYVAMVAKLLGISPRQLYNLRQSGKERLKKCLENKGITEDTL